MTMPDGLTTATGPGLASTLARNIRLMQDRAAAEARAAPLSERIAARVTAFTGSMMFVAIHLILFGAWIIINTLPTPIPPFDTSLVILAMWASVEAIFLSTFVLISQNRNAEADARRAELDLQISLLAEHEVTRLITLTRRIAEHLGLSPDDPELPELEGAVAPDRVLDTIRDHEERSKE